VLLAAQVAQVHQRRAKGPQQSRIRSKIRSKIRTKIGIWIGTRIGGGRCWMRVRQMAKRFAAPRAGGERP
jgi:hypothetical protein